MDRYSPSLSFILTMVLFLPFGTMLTLPLSGSSLAVRAIAFGIPICLATIHFSAAIYYLYKGGEAAESSPLLAAVQSAALAPRAVILEKDVLAFADLEHISGITRSSSGKGGDYYIPLRPSHWPSDQPPVLLKVSDIRLDRLSRESRLEGTIRRGPLPYLVRRNLPANMETFGVIIAHGDSVRWFWLTPAIMYGIGLLYWARSSWDGRRKQPTAELQTS